jgi:predicted AlkP superfamily pyrophosphatase or phosphodiesterase
VHENPSKPIFFVQEKHLFGFCFLPLGISASDGGDMQHVFPIILIIYYTTACFYTPCIFCIDNTMGKQKKVMLVIVDGMRADVACNTWGYIQSLCDAGKARRFTCTADNPSVSLPCYESILTGRPSTVHGVTSNYYQGKSTMKKNVFKAFKRSGRSTGAVCTSWIYGLYGRSAPFDHKKHKIVDDHREQIEHGRYYTSEGFEDTETMEFTDNLIYNYNPDFILLHLSQIDHIGHDKGIGSEYQYHSELVDEQFSIYFPRWLKDYEIVITADHGMNKHKTHGTVEYGVVQVPLYVLSNVPKNIRSISDHDYHHIQIANLCCTLGGVKF